MIRNPTLRSTLQGIALHVNSSNSTAAILLVLLIATIGASLALQGWKSRFPGGDSLLQIDGAHELLVHGRLPDRGALASFASYNPPGVAWLALPGVLLFNDPRLFESIGSITVYIGTLIGIFLLARACCGLRCAILAAAIYSLSEVGLYVAGSLWQRYPIHFFYVWMIYWAVQWVTQRQARYLGAALVTWASGMYMFMEIAPALFILPAVWLLYRPPVKPRPLLFAGVLALVIWYPYLHFEYTRGFADLRALVLRQSIFPANYKEVWCDPALTLQNLEGTPSARSFEPEQRATVTANIWTKGLAHLRPFWERRNLVIETLSSNCGQVAPIAGVRTALALLLLTGLGLLSVAGQPTEAAAVMDRHLRSWLPRLAVCAILSGLLWNEFVIARYLSLRGVLQPATVSSIRRFQVILVVSGACLLMLTGWIATLAARVVKRQAASRPSGVQDGQIRNIRVLVLSLIIPWLILLLVTEGWNVVRFWWLWPLQVIVLAGSVTYVPSLLRMPRPVTWVGSTLLVFTLAGNSLMLGKLAAWGRGGWAGADAEEVRVVDYVFRRLEGRNRAAVGYQVVTWRFMAELNAVDPRYKVGADFDLLFKYRHGVLNDNRCAEGVSPSDEFRIVQTSHSWVNRREGGYFDVPPDRGLHVLKQFGPYQVFRRE